jgi:hypothetical protein
MMRACFALYIALVTWPSIFVAQRLEDQARLSDPRFTNQSHVDWSLAVVPQYGAQVFDDLPLIRGRDELLPHLNAISPLIVA